MALPDLSNSLYVARLRFIQSVHEPPDRRNPDTLVKHFLPWRDRWRVPHLRADVLTSLRADPFYDFLIARTRYYDHVFTDAIEKGIKRIVSIGCGTDTRAYRFNSLLALNGVKVLECDQAEAIRKKRRITRGWVGASRVDHISVDLNDAEWPMLAGWLGLRTSSAAFVMLEGVSPYIDEGSFSAFLRFLVVSLPSGSQLAYDFKIRGVKDQFGRGGRTFKPFRLPIERAEVDAFHTGLGLQLDEMESSADLSLRLVPTSSDSRDPFREDCLIRLHV